jgi:hypothetical protein
MQTDFKYWEDYFINNENHFQGIDWQQEDVLSGEEKKMINSSLQQFQKGENSEGKNLYKYAKSFYDPLYVKCIRLFIREEQTHALVLAKFMDKHTISKIKNHWVDGVFRWLRKLSGIENTIIVLVTAEIIAKIYYRALANATGSILLKQICKQILQDEDQHIAFQCFTLHTIYCRKKLLWKKISRAWHLMLMGFTILVVWIYHKKVLKRGGYYFSRFFLETGLVYFKSDEMIKEQPVFKESLAAIAI